MATAPNQVWTWDITRLPGPRKWVTYPLYVVLDLFSRYVVAWMVATRGNGDTSAAADHQRMPEAGHRARTTHPAPGSRCADDGQDVFPAAGRPGYPGQLQSAAGVRRQPVFREPLQDRQIRAGVPGSLLLPRGRTDLLSKLLRLVQQRNTVTAAWGCSPPTPSTMA